ncbi:MAG: hypothetical protein CMB66_02345 [Euryarchaeota archaeon]|nr:hypothetical protein [Euryarchaeota archaeon]|tara:strand:- start:194 stop:991 length:798 start_codon:yes stop_codon:yes gene_type:complete
MPVSTEMRKGGVALVTLSPEASSNTFFPRNFLPLIATLDNLMTDSNCSSIVLTGSGRFFSVGGNIDHFSKAIDEGNIREIVQEMTDRLHPLLLRIRTSGTVFICAINGSVAGGGLGLALSADYRVCAPEVKLAPAFFSLGLPPDGGMTWLLPRLVGNQTAKRFFFEGKSWTAEQALQKGAVDEVVSRDSIVERAVEVAMHWGQWSVNSRKATKQLLDASTSTFFETQLQFEQSLMVASSITADFREGVSAFRENRKPSFSNMEEE